MGEEQPKLSPLPWWPKPGSVGEQLSRLARIALWAIGGFLIFLGLWIVCEFALVLFGDGDDEAIRNVGLIFLAVVGAPFVLYRTWVAGKQAKTAEQQATLAEDRNFSDLFTKAVEQLGADKVVKRHAKDRDGNLAYDGNGVPVMEEVTEPNIEVRLGAIYALQRISRASEKDHIPVMETLCAYIREQSQSTPPLTFDEEMPDEKEQWGRWQRKIFGWRNDLPLPRVDIQTALTVVGQRSSARVQYEQRSLGEGYSPDLSGANLQRANFRSFKFDDANLSGAYLDGASFSFGSFRNSWFSGCSLIGAYFDGLSLQSAVFDSTNMLAVQAINVGFQQVRFSGSKIRMGSFIGCDLESSSLDHSDLVGASITGCDCKSTNFFRSNLWATRFREVENFSGEQLSDSFGGMETDVLDEDTPCRWPTQPLKSIGEMEKALKDWWDEEFREASGAL